MLLLKDSEYKVMMNSAPVMMINIDRDGVIRYMNYVEPGYKMEEVVGSSVFDYVDPTFHDLYRENMAIALGGNNTLFEINVLLINKEAWFELHMAPIMKDGEADGIVIITQNITERKQAKIDLENAIREKEVLLTEVHHRAKNNLQVLSSILNLHKDKTNDNNVVGVLEECKNSIHSLALAHECLYKSNDFSKVDFADYIERYCSHFNLSVNSNSKVSLELDLSKTYVSLDKAITNGLILSEVLINAYKHAFPDRDDGKVKISLKEKGEGLELSISDNGVGFSADTDINNSDSLGSELIRILVDQLEGSLEVDSSIKGTSYLIKFH